MFAYVLIAFELLLLSFVYWFVFVREPKPYKVKESLWGRYGESAPAFTVSSITSDSSFAELPRNLVRRPRHQNESSSTRATRHGGRGIRSDLKNGWVYAESKRIGLFASLLAAIGQQLTLWSDRLS